MHQKGFTIPELLVAVSVAALASILIVTAFVNTYGSVVIEETRTSMTRQSQLFLRRVVEDIRVSNQIKSTNTVPDTYNAGGWVTSSPANILIATLPATDSSNSLIYDPITGNPYYHDVVYFSSNNVMYRRLLVNDSAIDNVQTSTCPAGTINCPPDIELVGNVESMIFEFYDVNDDVTVVPEEARSVQVTINLRKQVYGQSIATTNTSRITLRNEN